MYQCHQNSSNTPFHLEDLRTDNRPQFNPYAPPANPYSPPAYSPPTNNSGVNGWGVVLIVLGIIGFGFGAAVGSPVLLGKGALVTVLGFCRLSS